MKDIQIEAFRQSVANALLQAYHDGYEHAKNILVYPLSRSGFKEKSQSKATELISWLKEFPNERPNSEI
jgi:secreted trypsin-like serine protease